MRSLLKIGTLQLIALCAAGTAFAAQAQDTRPVTTMKEVTVVGQKDEDSKGGKFLPAASGTKVYSGKKTSYIALEESPEIINNNFRQALQKTPGLLLSEETTPLFSVGYRGLDPHRAQFTQVLKDGIPIHADMFGYPEAYYVPPLQVIDHIDFVHGGSALMYGPQPGGALNFVTKNPVEQPFYFETENSVGSHDLYSNYTAMSGTPIDSFGYYSFFHHRQGQGFRDANSQFELWYGGTKFTIEPDPVSKWTIGFDLYNETHGEPGGLTRAQFDADITRTTRLMDRFELNRTAANVAYQTEIDPTLLAEYKAYFTYYERASWRQRGGGFGTAPTGAAASTNDIENQKFYTGGIESRWRKDWEGFGSDEHKLTSGILYHHTTSPRTDERGILPDAEEGVLRKDSDRWMNYVSVFAENMFKWGRFSVTPGVRLENIWQGVEEHLNLDKTTVPLASEEQFDFVPLFGVGTNFEITPDIDLYANLSQSYRPKIFSQAVPTGTNQIVNGDLSEGESWQVEAGLRGVPVPYFSWDVSVFHMEFEDQIGSVLNTVQNVGDAEHRGIEATLDFDIVTWLDALTGSQNAKSHGSFAIFLNTMILDAEFVSGPNTGRMPQYAPDYVIKTGAEYRLSDRVKIRLAGTFVDDHFGDDTNSVARGVPSYKVWDLTAEAKVYKDIVTIFCGMNNLFDEKYFARVRGDGIDPADGTNYYGGAAVRW